MSFNWYLSKSLSTLNPHCFFSLLCSFGNCHLVPQLEHFPIHLPKTDKSQITNHVIKNADRTHICVLCVCCVCVVCVCVYGSTWSYELFPCPFSRSVTFGSKYQVKLTTRWLERKQEQGSTGSTSGCVSFRLWMKVLFSQSAGPVLPQHSPCPQWTHNQWKLILAHSETAGGSFVVRQLSLWELNQQPVRAQEWLTYFCRLSISLSWLVPFVP